MSNVIKYKRWVERDVKWKDVVLHEKKDDKEEKVGKEMKRERESTQRLRVRVDGVVVNEARVAVGCSF